MSYNVTIRGLSRRPLRVGNLSSGLTNLTTSIVVDLSNEKTTLLLDDVKDNYIRTRPAAVFTVTVATPGVFTSNGHGLVNGDIVKLSTTGALPTGLVAGTKYYVVSSSTNTFELSATYGGSAINTTGSQSGTHTFTHVSANILGLTARGFRIDNSGGSKVMVKIGSGVTQVDLTNTKVLRVLRRAYGQYIVTTSATSAVIYGTQAEQNGFNVYQQDTATATLTGSNSANATNGSTVTLGPTTYTIKTSLTEVKATNTVATSGTPASVRATGTVTTSGSGAANNDVLTAGGTTYTFKTSLTGAANEVLRTGVEDVDLTNLASAINATSGAGTTYGTGTVANASVTAGAVTAHVLTLTAISYNATVGNAVVLTKTSTALTVSGALLTGGTNESVDVNGQTYTFVEALDAGTANEVLINGQDTSLTNLASAINGTTGAGTTYGTGTVTNAYVTAGSVTSHAITLTAKSVGTAGNAYTLTKTGSHVSVGAGTFSGGVNSVANEVHIGGSADATLTNLSEAINAGANVGVDYSTATVANTSASASAVASHVITLTSLSVGQSGDSITFSTTETTYTAAPFANGMDNQPVPVYRGQVITVNPAKSNNFTQLRRHFRDWIEA